MAYPVYEDNGGMATGTDAGAAASYPGTVNADDILIAVCTDEDGDTWTTPSGWTAIRSSNVSAFSTATFWKRATGSESGTETFNTQLTDGSVVTATIFRFSGCVTSGTPFEADTVWNSTVKTNTATIQDITTLDTERLCISFACQEDNTAHSGTTVYTTNAADLSTDVGNDARVTLYTTQKATAGAVGSDSVTNGGGTDFVATHTMALIPAPSSTDIDATLGTVTVADYNPAVKVDTAFTATAGAVTVAGYNPAVKVDTAFTATAGAVTVAGYNASVAVIVDVSATLGTVTVAGYNASVAVIVDVSATLGAVTVASYNPSLSSSTLVSADTGTGVVASLNPSVAVTRMVIQDDATNYVTYAGHNVEIGAIATAVSASLGAVTVAGYNPALSAGVEINVTGPGGGSGWEIGAYVYPSASVLIESLNAAINAGTGVSASLGTVTAAGYNATVDITSQNTNVDASLGAVAVGSFNPDITTDDDIGATLGQVVVAGLNPSIVTGASFGATLGQVSVASFNPSIETDTAFGTTLGQLAVAGFNPSIVAGISFGATLGQVSVASFNPSIKADTAFGTTFGQVVVGSHNPVIKTDAQVGASLGTIVVNGFNSNVDLYLVIRPVTQNIVIAPYKSNVSGERPEGYGNKVYGIGNNPIRDDVTEESIRIGEKI